MDIARPFLAVRGAAAWLRHRIIRRRIPISVALITVLVAEDVLLRDHPHSVFNLRDPWSVGGLLLVLVGLFLRTWAAGVLQKNKVLATSGPYTWTRNPLYLGSFLMMAGFCVLIGDIDNLIIMGLLVLLVYVPGIKFEEAFLSKRYGEQWAAYAAHTPPLIPWRWRRAASAQPWSSRQWLCNREYEAIAGVVVGLTAIHIWHLTTIP